MVKRKKSAIGYKCVQLPYNIIHATREWRTHLPSHPPLQTKSSEKGGETKRSDRLGRQIMTSWAWNVMRGRSEGETVNGRRHGTT